MITNIETVRSSTRKFIASCVPRYPDYKASLQPHMQSPSFPIKASYFFSITAHGIRAGKSHDDPALSPPTYLLKSQPVWNNWVHESPQELAAPKKLAFCSTGKDGWQEDLHPKGQEFFRSVADNKYEANAQFQSIMNAPTQVAAATEDNLHGEGLPRQARRRDVRENNDQASSAMKESATALPAPPQVLSTAVHSNGGTSLRNGILPPTAIDVPPALAPPSAPQPALVEPPKLEAGSVRVSRPLKLSHYPPSTTVAYRVLV